MITSCDNRKHITWSGHVKERERERERGGGVPHNDNNDDTYIHGPFTSVKGGAISGGGQISKGGLTLLHVCGRFMCAGQKEQERFVSVKAEPPPTIHHVIPSCDNLMPGHGGGQARGVSACGGRVSRGEGSGRVHVIVIIVEGDPPSPTWTPGPLSPTWRRQRRRDIIRPSWLRLARPKNDSPFAVDVYFVICSVRSRSRFRFYKKKRLLFPDVDLCTCVWVLLMQPATVGPHWQWVNPNTWNFLQIYRHSRRELWTFSCSILNAEPKGVAVLRQAENLDSRSSVLNVFQGQTIFKAWAGNTVGRRSQNIVVIPLYRLPLSPANNLVCGLSTALKTPIFLDKSMFLTPVFFRMQPFVLSALKSSDIVQFLQYVSTASLNHSEAVPNKGGGDRNLNHQN